MGRTFDRTVTRQRNTLDDDCRISLYPVNELFESGQALPIVGQCTHDFGAASLVLQMQDVSFVAEHSGWLRSMDNDGITNDNRVAHDALLDDGLRSVERSEAGGLGHAVLLPETVNEVQGDLRRAEPMLRTGAYADPAIFGAEFIIFGIDPSKTKLALHAPPLGEVPPVTVREARADAPALVPTVGRRGIHLERQVHPVQVVLPAQEVDTYEVAPLAGLGPEAELRLNHPMFPFAVIAQRPPVVVAGHVHRPPAAQRELHAQVDRGSGVHQKVRFQIHFVGHGVVAKRIPQRVFGSRPALRHTPQRQEK